MLFPATVTTRTSYILSDADKNPDAGIQATESNNTVTVITGPLKFIVKGGNFNLIDEAWINEDAPGVFNDNNRIVTSGNDGGFRIKVVNTTYSSNTVTTGTATLYEKTGYHAIVKVTGRINLFPYTVYIYAYAGKPYIKVVSRYFYDEQWGDEDSRLSIRDIALILKTNIAGGDVRFSTLINNIQSDTGAAISSAQTDTAILNYSDPDNYFIKSGTTTLASGIGMSGTGTNGPTNMGWGQITSNTMGVAGAIRFMWQMAPKTICITGDGELGLHLYSNKGPVLFYYGGAGRTHTAGFSFSKSKDMTKEMFYAITQPLYAAAPAKWLSWQTKVMGNISPCEAAAFDSTIPAMISNFRNMGTIHGHGDRRTVVDGEHSYGFLSFGDLSDPPEGKCGGRYWSNNYYDFPHCIAQAYMVTASENNIETGYAHATHMLDMDHSSVTGQSRTGPGWTNWGNYTNCEISYSGTSNHYKCMGIFDWANILAEPVLGDGGLLVAQWAQGYRVDQIRSVGHILEALSAAYAYTDSGSWKNYLQNAFIQCNIDEGTGTITGDQPFQQAYLGEGMTWALLEIDTMAQARRALRAWADHWANQYNIDPVYMPYPEEHSFGDFPDIVSGFFPGLSGAADLFPENDTLYKRVLTDMWSYYTSPGGQGNAGDGRLKTFTQKFKGVPHYFHLAQKKGYNPMMPDYLTATTNVVAAEKSGYIALPNLSLSVCPNPFNGSTRINYSFSHLPGNSPISLSVYDVSGRLVTSLVTGIGFSGSHIVEWNGRDNKGMKLPSGIYMLALKANKQRIDKKIVLTR